MPFHQQLFTTTTLHVPSSAAFPAYARASVAPPPPLPIAATLLAALDVVEAAAMPFAETELRRLAVSQQREQQSANSGGVTAAVSEVDDVAALSVTPFHSSAVPPMTLAAYACHVADATGYGTGGLAVGLALMARYDRAAVAAATTDTAADTATTTATTTALAFVGVTALTMHRLFAACMQLGMKTASDQFVKNVYVAPLVGMTLAELNALELELAVVLDFRCYATRAEVCELPRALADLAAAGSVGGRVSALHRHAKVRALLHNINEHQSVIEGKGLPGFDDVMGVVDDEDVLGASTSASQGHLGALTGVAAASLTATYHP